MPDLSNGRFYCFALEKTLKGQRIFVLFQSQQGYLVAATTILTTSRGKRSIVETGLFGVIFEQVK
jgi:hypothetical protein